MNLLLGLLLALTPAPSAGDIAFKSGQFDQARAAFAAAASADPKDFDALFGLGTVELYRNQLADARRDLTAAQALAPGDAHVAARLATVAQREGTPGSFVIDMHGSHEVDVPLLGIDPLPTVHVTVNGHELTLLIDTGGTTIDLSPAAAKTVGAVVTPGGQGVFAGGLHAEVDKTTLATVGIGSISVSAVPADVAPGLASPLGPTSIDGVLGGQFLYHFLSTIDYRGKRLVLRPADDSSAFVAAASARGADALPMWLVGDHFIFARGHVNAGPDSLFNIDTGGAGIGVQLTRPALDAAHITPDMSHAQSFQGGGGEAKAVPFTATVSLGKHSEPNVPGVFFPEGDQFGIFPFTVAGTITHEFFKTGALTFDFKAMRMIFE